MTDSNHWIQRVLLLGVLMSAATATAVGCASPAPDATDLGAPTDTSVTSRASVSSVASSSAASAPPSTSTVLTLSLETSVVGNTIRASGRIALPDGARLSVGLQRTILDPEQPGDPGYLDVDYAETTVSNGRYSYDLVDNRKRDAAAFVAAYNEGEPPERHQRVGENIRVSVSFSPQSEGQTSAAVAAAGGRDGTALATSPQRDRIGAWTDHPYWTLLVEREWPQPLAG